MKQLLLMFVLLIGGVTNAQTFDFSCIIEKTRFEIIEDLAIAGEVDVTFDAATKETKVTVSPVGSGNFTIVEWPTEGNLSTMPEATFLVIKGRVEDAVNGYKTANLISERLLELNAIADEATYTHVEGAYHNEEETAPYGFRVIRTTSDGSEIDYFGNTDGSGTADLGLGISKASLGSEDTSGDAGWDKYLADAKQAVIDSEIDGAAAAIAMTAEELASLTASRTLELKAKSSATTSVTVRWDGGHIITVDENDILAKDHGHNNYGRSTQDQFDALLKVVEDAVIAADSDELTLEEQRIAELEGLSRDGVFVVIEILSQGWKIEFHDENGIITKEGTDGVDYEESQETWTNLDEVSDYQSHYDNAVQRVSDLVQYLIDQAQTSLFTITAGKVANAATAASTDDVLATGEYDTFPAGHSREGEVFVNISFSDKTGHLDYTLDNAFNNGGKLVQDATEEEFKTWVDTWASLIAVYQLDINAAKIAKAAAEAAAAKRADFISQLEAAFDDERTSTVDINLVKDSNDNDAVLFSEINGDIELDIKINDLLENKEQNDIDQIILQLPGYVFATQSEIDAYTQELDDKITNFGTAEGMSDFIASLNDVNDAINHATHKEQAVKALFTDLVGKSTYDYLDIISVTFSIGDSTYLLVNVYTSVTSYLEVRGPEGITNFDGMTSNQIKEFYLDVVERAYNQTDLKTS